MLKNYRPDIDGLRAISVSMRRPLFQKLVPVAAVCYALLHLTLFIVGYPGAPILMSDSSTYQAWSTLVPIGYPVFLSVVPMHLVPVVQFVIFSASVIALFFALQLTSNVAACIAVISLFGFSMGWFSAMSALTENLTMSFMLLHVAAIAWLVARQNRWALIAIGATVSIASLIRPASYFLFASLFAVPFLVQRERLRSVGIATATATVVFCTGAAYSYAIRGVATQTLGGMAMYGHVAHLFDSSKSALSDRVKDKAVELRDEINKKRAAAHSIVARQLVEMNEFNPTNHAMVHAIAGRNEIAIFAQLSRDAILANPIGYIETVAENVYAAYTRWSFNQNGTASSALLERLLKRPVAHPEALSILARLQIIPGIFNRTVILLAFVFSAFVLLRRIKYPIGQIGIYAASVHVFGIIFTSVATVFIPRYSVPLDPLVLVAISCAVGVASESLFGKLWMSVSADENARYGDVDHGG